MAGRDILPPRVGLSALADRSHRPPVKPPWSAAVSAYSCAELVRPTQQCAYLRAYRCRDVVVCGRNRKAPECHAAPDRLRRHLRPGVRPRRRTKSVLRPQDGWGWAGAHAWPTRRLRPPPTADTLIQVDRPRRRRGPMAGGGRALPERSAGAPPHDEPLIAHCVHGPLPPLAIGSAVSSRAGSGVTRDSAWVADVTTVGACQSSRARVPWLNGDNAHRTAGEKAGATIAGVAHCAGHISTQAMRPCRAPGYP